MSDHTTNKDESKETYWIALIAGDPPTAMITQNRLMAESFVIQPKEHILTEDELDKMLQGFEVQEV